MSTYASSPQFLTISQAARLLAVHSSTVRRWIHEGRLPAYRVGEKNVRVVMTDVLSLVAPLASPERGRGEMNEVEQPARRRLTEDEQQRGLQVLSQLEALDEEQGDQLIPDSTELIHQMRQERTAELLTKS